MWGLWCVVIYFGVLTNTVLGQLGIYEGSATGHGDVAKERFVESSNDPILPVDAQEYGECVPKSFPGLPFNMRGKLFTEMFICPNGFVSLSDPNMQNWPFTIGTLDTQRDSAFIAPYWSRVDLPAFTSGNSRVRYNDYHKDFSYDENVFTKVNEDVRKFNKNDSFEATWVSVITWEDVQPFDAGTFGGKNTFQAVFVSNETSWYLMYNYGDMDWAVRAPRADYTRYQNQAGLPVMGWNAGAVGFDYLAKQQYENLPYSGTVNAELIDDNIEGQIGTGQWIFNVGQTEQLTADLQCYQWYEKRSKVPVVPKRQLSCPSYFDLASLDDRFNKEAATETSERVCFINVLPKNGSAVRCCYGKDQGASLITSMPLAGSALTKNPLYFETDDLYGHTKCCIESNRCKAYYSLLPIETAGSYEAPHWAWGYGDPHYDNMDRMNYTFNGCGDYMFLDTDDSSVQIQVSFRQATGAGLGTVISAVILNLAGVSPIQINLKSNGGLLFLVNGIEYSGASSFGTTPTIIEDSVSVTKPVENQLLLTSSSGTGITIRDEKNHLVVTIVLERGLFGKTKGLLGNWSENTDDDWLLPDGTILTPPLTDKQIHFDFGEKWRLSDSDNLFVNTSVDSDFFCRNDYMPIFANNVTFPNETLKAAAEEICGNDMNCLFDIAATLSTTFGQTTKNSSAALQSDNKIIENLAPVFNVEEAVFNFTLGSLFEYTITASDANEDAFTIRVDGLPTGATAVQTGNSLKFSWLPNNTNPFKVSFIVTDSKNASTSLVPLINMCACQNGGTCFEATSTGLNALTFDGYVLLECRCAIGYEGNLCQTVKDFCVTESGSPCHPQVTCTNSPTGYICGPCPTGFGGDGQNCSDIDECEQKKHSCEMVCKNNAGSYDCSCNLGYVLNADQKNCDDVNECTSGHECAQTCENTEGSYNCLCLDNFKVDPKNPRNCIPETPCTGSGKCEHVCYVDESTKTEACSCNRGYRLQADGLSCTDINECDESTDRCSQKCTNTQGSYTCSCVDGYTLQSDSVTCEDDDECIENPTACDSSIGEKCFNLPGTFKCDCNDNQGLVRINGTCQVPTNSTKEIFEPAPTPPDATEDQISNAVEFRLSNFQSTQYQKQTDSAFRAALAEALTTYCNSNEERRIECGLPRNGFAFTELHVHRLANNPQNDGNDALISFYALYPNGTQSTAGVPVPRTVLVTAWTDRLDKIKQDTGLEISLTQIEKTEEESSGGESDELDWPLVLGVAIAGVLLLVLGVCVLVLGCAKRRSGGFPPQHDFYERGRWSFGDPNSQNSITGGSQPGFDEDGLPVEVGTNYGSGRYEVDGSVDQAYYNY
ncbi:mucin-like protein [Dendronephthya gigantea]|uniref:mucin-like protein n=1 Tax=Dendronephthya gigantea TaxID=151771 RepID=UPI00106AC162|nr:mucin-like protein [Dendronephthya gigantea]